MRLCKDCKHYEHFDKCTYHHDPKSLINGDKSFRGDSAREMRYGWPYFWLWNFCGKSGRLWEKRDDITGR